VHHHTVFGDLKLAATKVYRLHTQASVYLLGIHEARGRKYVILRGEPGSDREHVVVRDSDPRIGDTSLFELEPEDWVGHTLEVATMTTSEIAAVEVEGNPYRIASVSGVGEARSPWAPPVPPRAGPLVATPGGLEEHPRIQPGLSRGTLPNPDAGASTVARQIVVGQSANQGAEPSLAYPHRHVRYAEDAAALLRSLSRRDQIFLDLVTNPGLRVRLRNALDDCAELLKEIRKHDHK
jgi:hypothetical protein